MDFEHRPHAWWRLACAAAGTAVLVAGCGYATPGSTSAQALNSPALASPSAAVSPAIASPAASSPAPSPAPPPSPSPLATPDGPVTVIRGSRVTSGVQLGFPHTMTGAISAAAFEFTEAYGLDPAHEELVGQLTADSSDPDFPGDAAEAAQNLRKTLGLSATGPVPPGYSVDLKAEEYQLRDATPDQVLVILLCEITYHRPGPLSGASGVFPFLMHWENGDWKDAGQTGPAYLNLAAAPGSAKAAALGWHELIW